MGRGQYLTSFLLGPVFGATGSSSLHFFDSLSDFEKELKKRIEEIPSLKKKIKQHFRTKDGKAKYVPLKKEWKKEIVQFIRKIQTKRNRTFRVYQ